MVQISERNLHDSPINTGSADWEIPHAETLSAPGGWEKTVIIIIARESIRLVVPKVINRSTWYIQPAH